MRVRIGLLFCIENGLVYDRVWRDWLQYVPEHEYLVLVHARQPEALPDGSFASEHLIDVNITAQPPTEETSVEQHMMLRNNYDAERLLLTKAMQADEHTNPVTHFVLCDADSVPVKSFERIQQYIFKTSGESQRYSIIQFCPHMIKTEAGRKVLHMALTKYIHALRQHPNFAMEVPLTHWYWNSKFAIYCRDHVTTICEDTHYAKKLPEYAITNMSTHYPMLVLSQRHGDELMNVPTTFESWGTDGNVRVYHRLSDELRSALGFENILFATGIAADSGIEDALDGLWAQEPVVDPKTGETAQYTGL